MAHENSITVRAGADRFINIPSVVGGMQVSNEEAEKAYLMGQTEALSDAQGNSTWTNIEDAVSAAKARSEDTDPSNYAEGGLVAASEGTEYLREKLFQGEDDYFKDNPNVAGMAAEDNKVILNPYSKNSKEEQGAVYSNELSRIAMRMSKDKPTFALTPEQVEQFRGTSYEGNDNAMRQTIAARIYSNDPSAGRPTDEQMQYADKLKGMVNMIQNNKKTNYAEGGMIDPISGNEVPPGALPQEVRDDIPINVSEGEFIFPANAVRFFGVGKLEGMVQSANKKLEEMEAGGRMGGEAPLGNNFAEGGQVQGFTNRTQVLPFNNPETGRSILITFIDGKPIFTIPDGFVRGAAPEEDTSATPATPATPEAISEVVAPSSNTPAMLKRKIQQQISEGLGESDFNFEDSSGLTDAQASFAPGKDADGQMTGMDLYGEDDIGYTKERTPSAIEEGMSVYQAQQEDISNSRYNAAQTLTPVSLVAAGLTALTGADAEGKANEITNMRGNPKDGFPDKPTTTMGVAGNYVLGTPKRAVNSVNSLFGIKDTPTKVRRAPFEEIDDEEKKKRDAEYNAPIDLNALSLQADKDAADAADASWRSDIKDFFDSENEDARGQEQAQTMVYSNSVASLNEGLGGDGQLGGWDDGYGAGASGVTGEGDMDYGGQDDPDYSFNRGGLVKRRKRRK